MKTKLSRHIGNIKPGVSSFQILQKVFELRERGIRVIDMSIGEPDLDTPLLIKRAAEQALEEGYTHYSPAGGLPELRRKIAEYETQRKGVKIYPEEVVVLPGGKPVLLYSILALTDEDDEVVYFEPAFTSYRVALEMSLVKAVSVPLKFELGFRPNFDELERRITPRTRFIIVNSPHNPTGVVWSEEDVKRLVEIVEDHPELMILSDEVYSTLVFKGKHVSPIQFAKERVILLESFSKSFAMTGWRLGYGIFPAEMVPEIVKLVSHTISCTTTFVQRAGLAALSPEGLAESRLISRIFEGRMRLATRLLKEIKGIRFVEPQGAFYAFVDISATGMKSEEFADWFLENYHVAIIPGTAYGPTGEGFVRISLATSEANIREGLKRFKEAVERLTHGT